MTSAVPIQDLTPSQRRRGLTAVLIGMAVIGINVGLFNPLVALNLEARGVSTTMNGINAAMPYVAAIMFAPLVPMLVRRIGLLKLLLLSGAIDVIVILAFTLTDSIWAWLVLRYLVGFGMLFHWVGSEIWVNAAVTDRNRGKIIGLNGALFSGGMFCGPIVLGLLGTEGSLPFIASAGLIMLAMSPLMFAVGTAPASSYERRSNLWTAIRRAPTPMLSALVEGVLFVALFVQLPIYGLRSGLSEAEAITLLSALVIGGMVAPIPIGWLADHVNRRRLLILCGVLILVATLLLPVVFHNRYMLWVLLFVWGAGGGGLYTLGLVRLGELFHPGQLAAATAAFVMITHIGSIAGPVLAGGGMDIWNPHGFVVVTAATAFLFVAFGIWRYTTKPDAARRGNRI